MAKDPMIGGRDSFRPCRSFPEFRSLDCEKLDLHKAVTDPPVSMAPRMPVPKVGKLFERRRAVQIQIAAINSTIALITQRKCDVIHDT